MIASIIIIIATLAMALNIIMTASLTLVSTTTTSLIKT